MLYWLRLLQAAATLVVACPRGLAASELLQLLAFSPAEELTRASAHAAVLAWSWVLCATPHLQVSRPLQIV